MRVLLVDDHALVLKAVRNTLAKHYAVWTAATVDEALRVAGEVHFDVLVTDLDLEDPDGRDGFWLLGQLRERSGTPGLVLTGSSEHRDGVVVLRKPISLAPLRAAIDLLVAEARLGASQA